MARSRTLARRFYTPVFEGGGVPSISITGDTDMGTSAQGEGDSVIWTIHNLGTDDLELTLPITIDDANFNIVQPAETTIEPGGSTTFTIEATAEERGSFSGTVSVVNSSPVSPYTRDVSVIISQVFEDHFSVAASAPLGTGVDADVRGVWDFVESNGGEFSKAGGVLVVPAQTPAAVEGSMAGLAKPTSGQAYHTRPTGKALFAATQLNHTTRGKQKFGWWPSSSIDGSPRLAVQTDSNLLRINRAGTITGESHAYSATVDYPEGCAWYSEGYIAMAKVNDLWMLTGHVPASDTQAYLGISNMDAVGTVDPVVANGIDDSLYVPAISLTNPSVGNLTDLPDGDIYFETKFTTLPSTTFRLKFRKDGANGYELRVTSGGAIQLYRINSAPNTVNDLIAQDTTNVLSAGGTARLYVRGNQIVVERDNLVIITSTTKSHEYLRATGFELVANGGATFTVKVWKSYLRDAAGFGSEKVTNGDFASGSTGWTTPAGWAVSGGKMVKTAGAANYLMQNAGLTAGKYYKVVFTISDYVAGAVVLGLGPQTSYFDSRIAFAANGTYTVYLIAQNTDIRFLANSGTTALSLDDISVTECLFVNDTLHAAQDALLPP